MQNLWYTGFVVSGCTFLALAYVEWQVPGFVSFVFPVHLMLLITLTCGVVALKTGSGSQRVQVRWQIFALAMGIVGSLLVFQAADAFGAFRLLLAIIVLILPPLLLKALSDVKN